MRQGAYALLDELSKVHDAEFDWAVHVPDVTAYIRKAIADESELGNLVVVDIARKLTQAYVEHRAPPVPTEAGQLALWYDPDALLTLGDREVVRMEDARSQHVERWRTVLTVNFQAQSAAYFGHTSYIDDRLPRLRAADATLGEVEAGLRPPELDEDESE